MGQSIIDKIVIMSGIKNRFSFHFDGEENLREIASLKKGGILLSQTLFEYKIRGVKPDGMLDGEYITMPYMPKFMPQAEQFGLSKQLAACFSSPETS